MQPTSDPPLPLPLPWAVHPVAAAPGAAEDGSGSSSCDEEEVTVVSLASVGLEVGSKIQVTLDLQMHGSNA